MQNAQVARGVARARRVIAALVAACLCLGVASCAELTETLGSGEGAGDGSGSQGSEAPFSAPDMPELPDLSELPNPFGDGDGDAQPEAAPLPADQQPMPEPGIPGVGQREEGGQAGRNVAEARAQLASLQVKGRAPKNNYARAEFGQRWKDVDRNGCDQRNDVLARDMTQVNAPGGCKVLSGVLHDPFTGQTIYFQRGQDTSQAVQIDHVVALADAWQKGAQEWTPEKREQFGNDTMNLLAVDGPQNQKKGAGDAATWLPPNKAFRCQYVSMQIRVKATYGLWVTPAERDAMDRELGRC